MTRYILLANGQYELPGFYRSYSDAESAAEKIKDEQGWNWITVKTKWIEC